MKTRTLALDYSTERARRTLVLAWLIGAAALGVLALCCQTATGQEDDELKIPDPQAITVTTRDAVTITATFYPGGYYVDKDGKVRKMDGKEVVPVILVHDYLENRNVYDSLATYFQKLGHAVMVPDLRGHGRSTTRRTIRGEDDELDAEDFGKADLIAMVEDITAVKRYLLQLNNQGELNIELLTVVGAGVGGAVAMNWAVYDYSRPSTLAVKIGRDVKALALLSPVQSFKGLTTRAALGTPVLKRELSMFIAVGRDDREYYSDAKRIFNSIENFHTIPDDKQEVAEKQDLFLIEAETSLQGTGLLHQQLPIMGNLATFIHWRIVNKKDQFPWSDRTNPLSE